MHNQLLQFLLATNEQMLSLQNWEFEYYINNRTNSYVRNGTLFIKPVSNNYVTLSRFNTIDVMKRVYQK